MADGVRETSPPCLQKIDVYQNISVGLWVIIVQYIRDCVADSATGVSY